MARGGTRPKAGRKPGSANKRTRAIADKAAAEGITPLEVMIDNMRFYHGKAGDLLARLLVEQPAEPLKGNAKAAATESVVEAFKQILGLRDKALTAAGMAAPYMHAKLKESEGAQPNAELSVKDRLVALREVDAEKASNVVPINRGAG